MRIHSTISVSISSLSCFIEFMANSHLIFFFLLVLQVTLTQTGEEVRSPFITMLFPCTLHFPTKPKLFCLGFFNIILYLKAQNTAWHFPPFRDTHRAQGYIFKGSTLIMGVIHTHSHSGAQQPLSRMLGTQCGKFFGKS